MHEKIMRWPSKKLYHDRLTASPSVATHLLCDLEGVENIPETNEPVIFVDTAGLLVFCMFLLSEVKASVNVSSLCTDSTLFLLNSFSLFHTKNYRSKLCLDKTSC